MLVVVYPLNTYIVVTIILQLIIYMIYNLSKVPKMSKKYPKLKNKKKQKIFFSCKFFQCTQFLITRFFTRFLVKFWKKWT